VVRTPPLVSGSLPVLGHLVEFLRHPVELIERGARETDGVFRIHIPGKPTVVLLGAERSRFFFSETDKSLSIRTAYPFFVRMFDPAFYFFAEMDDYRRQREIVLPRFQGKQLEGYIQVMEAETAEFARRLGDSGEFDLTTELGPLVMRIAAHAFLGPDFGARLGRDFFEEFRRFSAGMDPVFPGWLPLPHLIRSRRARNRLRRTLGEMLAERRARPVDPPDFLQTLATARYSDGELVPDLILINLVLMLTWAGHETTTGHLAWAIVDLLRAPAELDRVHAEREREIGDGPLTLARINQLTHLDRCLHETERLHPVAHLLLRQAERSIELDGYHIPAGTVVLVAPSVTHRLADEHPDPDRFHPDRFAVERGRQARQERQRLIGFGGGAHRCLGVHFAYLEMKVILTRLFQRYRFELVAPAPRPVPGQHTKWPQSPCRLRYQRAEPHAVAS